MTSVWLKNFGDANYLWPEVLDKGWVSLISDEQALEYVLDDDEKAFRDYAKSTLKTHRLLTPDDGTITRWWRDHFRFMKASPDDLWVHDDGTYLYWTQLTGDPIQFETRPDPQPRGREGVNVTLTIRPTIGWSNRDKAGRPLAVNSLHPRVTSILRTRMTMAKASPTNAAYAWALINGEPLDEWHERSRWIDVANQRRQQLGVTADDWGKSFYAAAKGILQTVASSGKETTQIAKLKNIGFSSDDELISHLLELHDFQRGKCALTGLFYRPRFSMLPQKRSSVKPGSVSMDSWLQVSPDRIDSGRGYEKGNIQLTCWFANYWEGSQSDEVFAELLTLVAGE